MKRLIQNIECGNVFFLTPKDIISLLREARELYGFENGILFTLRTHYTFTWIKVG